MNENKVPGSDADGKDANPTFDQTGGLQDELGGEGPSGAVADDDEGDQMDDPGFLNPLRSRDSGTQTSLDPDDGRRDPDDVNP